MTNEWVIFVFLSKMIKLALLYGTFVVFYEDQLAHLLVCLVYYETRLLKTLILGKTELGMRWLV